MASQDELRSFFSGRHKKYVALEAVWEKMRTAYEGGEAAKIAFLVKREKEKDEDYGRRLKLCSFEGILADIIKKRANIVFSRPFGEEVDTGRALAWDYIKENVDRLGTPIDDYIRSVVFPLAQVYGYQPVFVDKPLGLAEDAGDQADKTLYPFAKLILPGDLLNWRMGEDQRLEWALIRSRRTVTPDDIMRPQEEGREFRVLTRTETQVWIEIESDKGEREYYQDMDASAEHGCGEVPLVILRDEQIPDEQVVARASLLNSCEQSIAMFNEQSWAQNVAYKTNFSTLAAELTQEQIESGTVTAGEGQVLVVAEGAGHMPAWISPDVAPLVAFDRRVRDMRRRAYEQAQLDSGHAEDTKDELSGEAYDRRARDTEHMALNLGKEVAAFKEKLIRLMLEGYEGDGDLKVSIAAPRRYGIRATRDAIQELEAVEGLESLPPEVRKEVAARIVDTDGFVELSDEERVELQEKIRAYDAQAEAVELARLLKQAETEPLEKLEDKRIAYGKQHSEAMAQKNIETARINAEATLEAKRMDLEHQAKVEQERPKEEKKSAWAGL